MPEAGGRSKFAGAMMICDEKVVRQLRIENKRLRDERAELQKVAGELRVKVQEEQVKVQSLNAHLQRLEPMLALRRHPELAWKQMAQQSQQIEIMEQTVCPNGYA